MRYLVARLDNAGDVLLAGPAVRAAASGGEVVFLCGPDGEAAARLLPGVTEVVVWDAPWTGFDPPPVDGPSTTALVDKVASLECDAAAILTSFHQSPLPLALLFRMAGIGRIAAVSVDYPGSLLDHRVPYREDLHEVEQALAVTSALGIDPPADDRLAIDTTAGTLPPIAPGYVVVHPGASVAARALPAGLLAPLVERLAPRHPVVVTGTELEETRSPLPPTSRVTDLRGRTSFGDLAAVISAADAVVVGNTAPAHVAAATGTPVVSVFAPVVPAHRWQPWRVPAILLGNQAIACAGCRSRLCPLPVQECISGIDAEDVLDALDTVQLMSVGERRPA